MLRSELVVGDVFKYEGTNELYYYEVCEERDGTTFSLRGHIWSDRHSCLPEKRVVLIAGPTYERLKAAPSQPADPAVSEPPGPGNNGTTAQAHYTALSPEPIDVIEAWGLGFRLANAIKYIGRAGRKPGVEPNEDLEKAISYLRREINARNGTPSW